LLGCVDLVDCLSQEDYRQKVRQTFSFIPGVGISFSRH
jgi:hypothetical protein